MKIQYIEETALKASITDRILRCLPEWFGIEEAIVDYVNTQQDKLYLAAIEGEEAVGFLSVQFNNEHTAEIYVMGVLPAFHREGIGSSLIIEAETYLKTKHYTYLMVKTLGPSRPDQHYERTRCFYGKSGFLPVEELTQIWGKENPCLIMIKKI